MIRKLKRELTESLESQEQARDMLSQTQVTQLHVVNVFSIIIFTLFQLMYTFSVSVRRFEMPLRLQCDKYLIAIMFSAYMH